MKNKVKQLLESVLKESTSTIASQKYKILEITTSMEGKMPEENEVKEVTSTNLKTITQRVFDELLNGENLPKDLFYIQEINLEEDFSFISAGDEAVIIILGESCMYYNYYQSIDFSEFVESKI